MKVLHVLYSSLPSTTGGDIRSRDVVESQADVGLSVLVVSSPFQPPSKPNAKIEQIGGVSYHRCSEIGGGLVIAESDQGITVKLRKALALVKFRDVIADLARRELPDVIHAHSTFFCAIAGWLAARRLGLPLVYEVRSLWEERWMIHRPSLKAQLIARAIRTLETFAMRMANHVVVISNGLICDVQSRGIPRERITLIGNGVSLAHVQDEMPSLLSKPSSELVFAYIGNFSHIEGLDLLIKAVRDLRAQGWNNPLHLHGSGPVEAELRKEASDVPGIIFYGRFEPCDVADIYATVDIVVNPRRRSPLTDKVTPLKPLEAMAWRKPVIVSSVCGMLELVRDGETGFIFEADDAHALAATLMRVSTDLNKLPAVIERARRFVECDRSWHANGLVYKELYERLTEGRP